MGGQHSQPCSSPLHQYDPTRSWKVVLLGGGPKYGSSSQVAEMLLISMNVVMTSYSQVMGEYSHLYLSWSGWSSRVRVSLSIMDLVSPI